MKFVKIGLAVLSLSLMLSLVITSQAKAGLSGTDKKDVEDIVRTLLLEKEPDLIIKAAEEMQRRAEKINTEKGSAAIKSYSKYLHNDKDTPIIGNKNGDVSVVEFFDYQCGYCKVVVPALTKLIKNDRNVKVVLKEYPILGAGSLYASRAALASIKQNKYFKFHEALMGSKKRLNEKRIMSIAKKIGLNTKQLAKDMNDPLIQKMIDKNLLLGKKIGARGTPSFIIGKKLLPGAVPLEQIQKAIADVRNAKK